MDSDQPAGEVPYGTLDLMVLKTLQVMGALHGYAIARRIEQVARGSLALNQGTIYPALFRLEQKGWNFRWPAGCPRDVRSESIPCPSCVPSNHDKGLGPQIHQQVGAGDPRHPHAPQWAVVPASDLPAPNPAP